MDIFFVDIGGLTVDLRAPAATGSKPPTAPDRPGDGVLPGVGLPMQAFEFNAFFDHLSVAEPTPDDTLRALPDDAWNAFLAQAPVRVTTDGEPALMRPAATEATLRGASTPPLPTGESLPANGKPLPAPIAGAIVARPASDAAATPPSQAADASRIVAVMRSPAPAEIQSLEQGERLQKIANADAATWPTDAARREVLTALRGADGPGTRFEAGAGSRAQTPTPLTGRSPQPVAPAVEPTVAKANATSIASLASADTATRRPSMAAVVPAGPIATREGRPGAPTESTVAALRGGPSIIETAAVITARPQPATPSPATFGIAEMPGADGMPARAAEVPTSTPATSVTSGAAPAVHALATPVAPGGSGTPLPPQFESLALPRQAGAADWGNGLGERVSWMIDQRHNSATIRLDPPTLGKLDVQVRIADDATTITIQTQHAPTRELIEASAPRLRDFLQDSGFQNVNVDVSQRQDQQQARAQTAPDARDGADGASPEPDHPGPAPGDPGSGGDGVRLVDTFV